MKLKLPAVSEPLIRVLVLTADELHHLDYCGDRPQEVDIELPGVDIEKAKIGYVGVDASGEEVGEPVLLHAEPQVILGEEVVVDADKLPPMPPSAGPVSKPAAEAPPETVKIEEKPAATVKTGRK